MNIRSTKKNQTQNPILIIWLVLMIGISACDGNNTPASTSNFEYQVRVQAKDTGSDLPNAQVRIEVAAQAPINDFTDSNGIARIFIDSSREGQPARLIVETPGYGKYVQQIDLIKDKLPTIIQLESGQSQITPILTNTPIPFSAVKPTKVASSTSCPWIPYLNGTATFSFLSGEDCLNDLKSSGISGNGKQISFFVHSSYVGMYGVCQDISERDNLEFHVAVDNDIASARFLVTLGPGPIPNKSSYGFRFQPQIQVHKEKEMYIKFIQYTFAGYDKGINEMKAIPDWKYLDNWDFDFVLQFNGAKVNTSINQALREEWQLDPSSRYLCFAYEATPTAAQSAQLEVQVKFP